MIKVVLLGTGSVSKHLFAAIQSSSNARIVQVFGRSETGLISYKENSTTTSDPNKIKDADIYIIAVSDDSINFVCQLLKDKNGLVVHTSGSMDISTLLPVKRKGVFYPLQTFSKNRSLDLQEVPFCLETELPEDYPLLEQLAKEISSTTYLVNSEQRKQLHLAAVYANNFTNHFYFLAENICKDAELPFAILQPLILESAKKLEQITPFDAQTGPARRGDKKSLKSLSNLIQDTLQKDIFADITKSIERTYDQKL